MTKNILKCCILAVAASCLPLAHAADIFPSRSIRLIVPFAPGGGADTSARRIVESWGHELGQSVVIENKSGAGGTLGASFVAKAAPDGYTLLYTTAGQQMTAPFLLSNLGYDPYKDLVSVGRVAEGTNALIVGKNVPAHTVQELIDYAKAHPNELSFASSGIGSTSHLGGELFKKEADIDIVHVPYRGTGPAMNDVLGGRVAMTIDNISIYMPHIKSGELRALGVSTKNRSPIVPDIPTIAETLPGFEAFPINYITAPAGTPKAVIQTLNAALNKTMKNKKLQESFSSLGTTLVSSTPEEMDAFVRSEQKKWKALIEGANIKIE